MVRQGTLTPSLAGSSPAIPAKVYPEGRTGMIGCLPSCENKPSAPLAQSVEHLPFKQGVRGSNPRRGTKKRSTAKRCFSFWHLVDSKRAPTSHGPTGHRSRAQQSGGLLHKRESNPLRRPTPRWGGRRNHVASDLHPRFPPHTPLSLPHREAIPSNTTKLGIPHGASLFGIWWIRNELRLRATQQDVEAGRNIPPAHRGGIPQFFCWKNRRTCGIIS